MLLALVVVAFVVVAVLVVVVKETETFVDRVVVPPLEAERFCVS